jgi:D-alanyl-D-alanine endopeptidase (penicillin-binding protein 7)
MIARALAQLLFAASLFSVAPVDASLLENSVSASPAPLEAAHFLLTSGYSHLSLAAERTIPPPKKIISNSFGVATSADSSIVVDVKSGATLYAEKPDDVRPMGSITKLMTAMVFLDTKPDIASSVKLIPDDYVGGGRTYLKFDDGVKLRDVLGTALVGSDNTAAHSLSRLSGLSDEDFVKKMNEKAKELRMAQTVFVDPSGISSENVSTARDLSLLLLAASEDAVLKKLMQSSVITVSQSSGFSVNIESTNLLLGSEANSAYKVAAGKTGYIPQAGYCLAAVIEHEGNDVVIVVLGAKKIDDRFTDAKNLAVWVFKTFVWPKP